MSTNVQFDLQAHLTQLEERITGNMERGFEGVNGRLDKLNGRVGKLENWRNFLTGAWAVISVGGVYILKGLWAKP